jgi:hypothetical protein
MPSFQITDRIKQDVRNARVIGEFTVKIGLQKLPGLIWGVISKTRDSIYPEPVPRVRPEEHGSSVHTPVVPVAPVTRLTEPCDGYDLLTGTQVVELLQSVSEVEVRNIHDYECTHRNRAVVIAAAQARITVQ